MALPTQNGHWSPPNGENIPRVHNIPSNNGSPPPLPNGVHGNGFQANGNGVNEGYGHGNNNNVPFNNGQEQNQQANVDVNNDGIPYNFMEGENVDGNAWRFPRTGAIVTLNPDFLGDSRAYWASCFLGYLVDYRLLSAYSVNRFIEDHWVTRGLITVHRLNDIYAFHCSSAEDREELLAQSAACFDGALMVFTRWTPDTVPRTVRFPFAYMWVRVCGLPFEYLNRNVAGVVGQLLSDDFTVEQFDFLPENDYLRIRARIRVGEPLVPGFFMACGDGELLWVQFRYEEVFKYCTRCGKIGHKSRRCVATPMVIVNEINRGFQRVVDRGFVVFQANSPHTMYTLDLRALPSTTRYATSRVRLGDTEGVLSPSDYFVENIIEFDLETTPGGRVLPGMRFLVSSQPFSSPIFLANIANHTQAPPDVNMQHAPQNVQENTQDIPLGQRPMERGESSRARETFVVADPYDGNMNHGESERPFDYDMNVQDTIASRVEHDEHVVIDENDYRGYNQTFIAPGGFPTIYHDPPPDFVQNIPSPIQIHTEPPTGYDGWLDADSQHDGSMDNLTPDWPDFSESPLANIQNGGSTHSDEFVDAREESPFSGDNAMEISNEVAIGEVIIISSDDEDEASNGSNGKTVAAEEDSSKATQVVASMSISSARNSCNNNQGISNIPEVSSRGLKRKAITDPSLAMVPKEALVSPVEAMEYIRQMTLRRRVDNGGPSFRMEISDDIVSSPSDNGKEDGGSMEVVPNQPPRSI